MSKADPLMAAIGDVDEANSALGVAVSLMTPGPLRDTLTTAQNELFDLGADLATPWRPDTPGEYDLRVTAGQVTRIEAAIDAVNDDLSPLTSFILPGGSSAAAAMHVARATVRRAERSAVAAGAAHPINPEALTYINRLSDLLFCVARALNKMDGKDVLWVPGASR